MSGRSLAYLKGIDVRQLRGVGSKVGGQLAKMGITKVADLLLHFPHRHMDRSSSSPIAEAVAGEEATLFGTVTGINLRRLRGKRTMVEANVADGTGSIRLVWWNQPFREKNYPPGTEVVFAGKVDRFKGSLQMNQPDMYVLGKASDGLLVGGIVPVHSSIKGLAPRALLQPIAEALRRSRPISEVLPAALRLRHGLASRDDAIASIHFPQTLDEVERARARLVFDELFRIEVALAMRKHRQIEEATGIVHDVAGALADEFVAGLPYELTGAQRRVVGQIRDDLVRPHPMHRLLQGEVGSGKTAVAMASLLIGVEGGYQGAVMAPTEVLAEQHYLALSELLRLAGMAPARTAPSGMDSLFAEPAEPASGPVRLALLTSNATAANFRERSDVSRTDVLDWIAAGEVDVVVGTHALIQEGVEFASLGIAVVDEQHRFGVHQRVELREKGKDAEPDLLIMTATPIPRTMAMTLYGDLDVSVLDEMPPGRTPVATHHATKVPADLERVYAMVRAEAAAGRQTFVVCPLVEDSDKVYAKSATTEYERLQGVFPDLRVGLIHGQLRPADKEQVMAAFRAGDIDVLVATTVIEVGIDVPNATVMVIEDADRFGLSQLHQLRGRVGRGRHASHCWLVAEPTTPEGTERIAAMLETTDGFRLAEKDLELRGQGTVFGARQAGLGDLRLADVLRDFDTLVAARDEAFKLVASDPRLDAHPELAAEIKALLGEDVEWLFRS